MVVKDRELPLIIPKLLALLRRLALDHLLRPKIEESLRNYQSGHKGEVSLDFYLSYLPEKETYILHSLRLPDKKLRYYQIDTLIITSKFILILEIKNLAGTLIFDPLNHQLIQQINNKENVYEDPVLQAERQKQYIAACLSSNHFPQIPIIPLVVISNSSSQIKFTVNDKKYQQKIIRSTVLPQRFDSLNAYYNKICLTDKDIRKLSRQLIKNHSPLDVNVLEKFKINPSEIITGVHCNKCFFIPMHGHYGTWTCVNCGHVCKDALIDALYDYALLYGKEITNAEARRFLQIDSISIITKLFKKLNLEYTGTFKDRVYHLSYPSIKHV